ncbi:MAG: preprotein translocase subunit SecE [Desulfosalsimonadaceae bacterium]|nr:preprotein translocase subunit SecE [Desulfosalsimonadaceae bacterium]
MARIQKKKTIFKAKKKPDDISSDAVKNGNSVASSEAVSSGTRISVSDTGNDPKKMKTPALRQSSGTEQTAVMKLADKYFGNWIQFFREVKIELTKVTWPSKKQTIGSTVVVILFVFIISLFLGVVDFGLSNLVRLIL